MIKRRGKVFLVPIIKILAYNYGAVESVDLETTQTRHYAQGRIDLVSISARTVPKKRPVQNLLVRQGQMHVKRYGSLSLTHHSSRCTPNVYVKLQDIDKRLSSEDAS